MSGQSVRLQIQLILVNNVNAQVDSNESSMVEQLAPGVRGEVERVEGDRVLVSLEVYSGDWMKTWFKKSAFGQYFGESLRA